MERHQYLPTPKSLLLEPEIPLIHRDLSWLHFNERVLAEARQTTNPLLERAKFLSITASNLDEFFMIRFPSIQRDRSHFDTFCEGVSRFLARQSEAFDLLTSDLLQAGARILRADGRLPEVELDLFRHQIEPHLIPIAEGPDGLDTVGNLELIFVTNDGSRFRLPRSVPTLVVGPGGALYFTDDLLNRFGTGVIRLTRDADVAVEVEGEDPEAVPGIVRRSIRRRDHGQVTRIQFSGRFSQEALELFRKHYRLKREQIFLSTTPLGLHGLGAAIRAHGAPKFLQAHAPIVRVGPVHSPSHLWKAIQQRDILLHHPYDTFETYLRWLESAVGDPDVVAIDHTLYRTDSALSPLRDLLCKAASTKRVRVVIEPRARFDELNNVRLAEELKRAGCEVTLGLSHLKVHAKIALITRRENGLLRHYTHLSTGNYHSATAQAYTDLALLTAHPELGADAKHFFDRVSSGKVPGTFKHLVSAPRGLFYKISEQIAREIQAARGGAPARIFAKVNALIDPGVISALYQASQAGVRVDLLVRGACSLIPGVKGLSENIRVLSLVDRYLEHSRIYYFQSTRTLYLSSADWMPRNFFSRLEIAFPILCSENFSYLENVVIPTYLGDTQKAKELTPQGAWKKRAGRGKRAQDRFGELAISRQDLSTPHPSKLLADLIDPKLGEPGRSPRSQDELDPAPATHATHELRQGLPVGSERLH